ncbi:MAG: CRISPR-associated helicase Cas3' [Clostridiales bacterium]|nr:CRISPR-associated helicase Cas3' [Clostridiales bacterium]
MESYAAHIQTDLSEKIGAVQSVSEHCRNTAKYAAAALAPIDLSAAGETAGLLHDLGKYTECFQAYIKDGIGTHGSVNHTFSGVRLLLERFFKDDAENFSSVVSELLSLAVGGHHGLFDCVDDHQKSGFQHRLTKEGIGYEKAVENFFRFCVSPEELDQRFQAAQQELTPVLERICAMTSGDNRFFDDETAFYSGLLARLVLSAVIEGDRRDTAEFLNGAQFPQKRSNEALEHLWSTHLKQLEEKLNQLPNSSLIDQARHVISAQCRQAAEQPGGVFRLNVPTGGGKTLSSLRFALAHAHRHRKQRIIFTSPLLSILEQNAAVIRDYIQDDSLILEHHSNLIQTAEVDQQLDEQELLTETWESPIIITTLVQVLNTLFSGKTTAIRRFHSLCGSIIIIDEVQTVPSKILSLFSLAINFLSEICGTTVVLCSATQPCTERIEHPLHSPIPEIVPYNPALWAVFHRTDIQDAGTMSLEQIADFALKKLGVVNSLLIVCNKKSQAEHLYNLLKGGSFDLFSLSAAMCVAHRRDTLDKLRRALTQDIRKVVCVSTQVIEAGVDISFACVIRLSAGMDRVVQAAGRCNRSGEAGPGILAPVYLVQCQDESLAHLPDIQKGQGATQELLTEFAVHPEPYHNRLDSDEAIGYYYRALYRLEPNGHHDYCIKGRPSLFSLLSLNDYCTQEQPYYFRQAFRLAGSLFQVFEENTTDVIVPYGEGAELIRDLCSERAERDVAYLRSLLETAKPYAVSLYQYQIDYLNAEHSLIPLQGGAMGLNGHYQVETGFSMGEPNLDFLGV